MCINPGHQQNRNLLLRSPEPQMGSHLVILGGNSLVSKSFVNFALENSPEKMPPLCEHVSLFALIIPERGHTVNSS